MLGLNAVHFKVEEKPSGKVQWEDQVTGVPGEVDSHESFRSVWRTDSCGARRPLHTEVRIESCLSDLYNGILSAARFVFNQCGEDTSELHSVTENVEARIQLHRPLREDSSFTVHVPGQKETTE